MIVHHISATKILIFEVENVRLTQTKYFKGLMKMVQQQTLAISGNILLTINKEKYFHCRIKNRK